MTKGAPNVNQPLSLLVKEFSAKLNRTLYGQKTSDATVDLIIDKIKANPKAPLTYIDVYELGFSNNKRALPFLKKLIKENNEYVRLAAISSLGILQDEASLELLKGISVNARTWSDRAMALKSIGDIGSVDAKSYLKNELSQIENETSKEALWNKEIIALYL